MLPAQESVSTKTAPDPTKPRRRRTLLRCLSGVSRRNLKSRAWRWLWTQLVVERALKYGTVHLNGWLFPMAFWTWILGQDWVSFLIVPGIFGLISAALLSLVAAFQPDLPPGEVRHGLVFASPRPMAAAAIHATLFVSFASALSLAVAGPAVGWSSPVDGFLLRNFWISPLFLGLSWISCFAVWWVSLRLRLSWLLGHPVVGTSAD